MHGFLVFSALWVPVWWAWVGFSFYADRFDTDDALHRVLAFALMFATAGLASTIPDAFRGDTSGFALGYAATRTVVVLMNLRAWWHLPPARPLLNAYIAAFSTSSVLFVVSTGLGSPARYVVWAVALALDLGTPLMSRRRIEKVPIHGSHVPERIGLLTTIVFGETVLAVVIGTEHTHWGLGTAGVAALGFMCAACLWWIYYDYLDQSLVRRTVRAGQTYLFTHLPLLIGLTALGPAVRLAIVGHSGDRPGRLVGVALVLVLASLAVLHLVTSRSGRDEDAWLRVLSGAAIGAAAIATPLLGDAAVFGIAAAMLAAQLAFELHARGGQVSDVELPLGPASKIDA